MVMENPRIEESPQRPPGNCRCCGAGSLSREWFIDLDVDDLDGGAIQICNVCLHRIAEMAGYTKFELVEQMNAEYINELETEVHELRNVSHVLHFIGLDPDRLLRIGRLAGVPLDDEPQPVEQPDSDARTESDATAVTISDRESRQSKTRLRKRTGTSESSDDEGMESIRGSAGGHTAL